MTKANRIMPSKVPREQGVNAMAQVTFRDPGPSMRGQGLRAAPGKWVDLLKPLLQHPGKWAVIETQAERADVKSTPAQRASTTAAQLRGNKTRKPDGKWEFTSRGPEVFAKYIGPA